MALSSPGIGSNLDVNGIVTKLMSVERAPLERLGVKEASYQAQLSAYGSVRSALSGFQGATDALANPSRFLTRTASSSDTDVLTASVSSTAQTGTYRFDVSSLARAQTLVAVGQSGTSTAIGSGASTELRFEFGRVTGGTLQNGVYSGASFETSAEGLTGTVTIDASNNTLSGIKDAINAADLGVRASIVGDGSANPYRLVLESEATGAASAMRITVTGDAALQSLLGQDPAGTQNMVQTVEARDAAFTVNGLSVSSASNNLADVVEGATISLLATGTSTVKVGRDTSAAVKAVQDFAKAYNDLNTTLNGVSASDARNGTRAPLNGDAAVRGIQARLRAVLGSSLGPDFTFRTLSQVGVTFQRDGTLSVDSARLGAALGEDPDAVRALFARSARPSDAGVSVVAQTSATQPGDYAVNVATLATQGSVQGSAPAATAITSGVNDSLSVVVDGKAFTVVITSGSYTSVTLAAAVQAAINGVATGVGVGVTVTETAGVLRIASNRFGADSQVSVGGNGASDLLGFAPVSTTGVDAAGSIGGSAATGEGRVLQAADGSLADGLRLEITGGATGDRGSVTVGAGLASRVSGLVQGFLDGAGPLASRTEGIGRSIADLGRQRAVLERRLQDVETRYRSQFTTLDTMLSSLLQTSNFLSQQLAALNKS